MTKRDGLVHGVGINDADYSVTVNAKVSGKKKQLWMCPMYSTWRHVLERCHSEKFLARCPTYAGCTAVSEWMLFSAFRSWMTTQDYEGKQLDKDILVPGNKIYGPDTCVFVSSDLNVFLTENKVTRGEWPVGVCWNKWSGKFQVRCNNPFSGKHENLGYFATQEEAHAAWRSRKHELACTYADVQTDARIANALRTRYAAN